MHTLFTESTGISPKQVGGVERQPSSHDNTVQSWVAHEVYAPSLIVIVVKASSELPVPLDLQLLVHKLSGKKADELMSL